MRGSAEDGGSGEKPAAKAENEVEGKESESGAGSREQNKEPLLV